MSRCRRSAPYTTKRGLLAPMHNSAGDLAQALVSDKSLIANQPTRAEGHGTASEDSLSLHGSLLARQTRPAGVVPYWAQSKLSVDQARQEARKRGLKKLGLLTRHKILAEIAMFEVQERAGIPHNKVSTKARKLVYDFFKLYKQEQIKDRALLYNIPTIPGESTTAIMTKITVHLLRVGAIYPLVSVFVLSCVLRGPELILSSLRKTQKHPRSTQQAKSRPRVDPVSSGRAFTTVHVP